MSQLLYTITTRCNDHFARHMPSGRQTTTESWQIVLRRSFSEFQIAIGFRFMLVFFAEQLWLAGSTRSCESENRGGDKELLGLPKGARFPHWLSWPIFAVSHFQFGSSQRLCFVFISSGDIGHRTCCLVRDDWPWNWNVLTTFTPSERQASVAGGVFLCLFGDVLVLS